MTLNASSIGGPVLLLSARGKCPSSAEETMFLSPYTSSGRALHNASRRAPLVEVL